MARNKSAMWGAYRAPRHGAQMRALRAIEADVRVLGEEPGIRTVSDVVKEGVRADLVRSDRGVNGRNARKRRFAAANRAFKAQRQCAEAWDYSLL